MDALESHVSRRLKEWIQQEMEDKSLYFHGWETVSGIFEELASVHLGGAGPFLLICGDIDVSVLLSDPNFMEELDELVGMKLRDFAKYLIQWSAFIANIQSVTGDKTVPVLNLCSGASTLGVLLASLGHRCLSLDYSSDAINLGKDLSRTLLGQASSRHQLVVGDVLRSPLSSHTSPELWTACRPCTGGGWSLPDRIILQWVENPAAKKLVMSTCCPGRWAKDYPSHLAPWVGNSEQWAWLCQEAERQNESEASSEIPPQDRFEGIIDNARLEYLKAQGIMSRWDYSRAEFGISVLVAQK